MRRCGEDTEDVVVAERVVDFQAEILLGLGVEIVERAGSSCRHAESIEDMVTALNGEVRTQLAGAAHGQVGSVCGVQLRLDVAIGEEEKLKRRRGSSEGGQRRGSRCGSS